MTIPSIIYLDYAATTPVDPRVAEKMAGYLTFDGIFANPASRSHMFGWQAEAAVENARKQIATLLNADTREIIFTSGATEANNLAIKGVAAKCVEKGKHIITSAAEHKAVIDSCRYLEEQGYDVTYLAPTKKGCIDIESLAEAIREDTILISFMHVNNETGAINDIKAIGSLAKEHGIPLHVDAAQSAGKLTIDTQDLDIDYLSICAHKIYGPKGIGALYVKRSAKQYLQALIHGGGHEQGLRSGTLATHQIVGLGESFELANTLMSSEYDRLSGLRSLFLDKVAAAKSVVINSDVEKGFPGIVNVGVESVDGEVLLSALPGVAISSGSACTSASVEPSHVLKAMGIEDELALSSLRFSFGRFTQESDVKKAAEQFVSVVNRMTEA